MSDRRPVARSDLDVLEEQVLQAFDDLAARRDIDKRWLAIARTDLERAFMGAHRAILAPPRKQLPGGSA